MSRTSLDVRKDTRDRLAAEKYRRGAKNYDEAIRLLLDDAGGEA